jgi:hypothetical protein
VAYSRPIVAELASRLAPRRWGRRRCCSLDPTARAYARGSQPGRSRHAVSGSGSGRSPAGLSGQSPVDWWREDGVSVGRIGEASRRRALRSDSPPLPARLRPRAPASGSPKERATCPSLRACSRRRLRTGRACLRTGLDFAAAKYSSMELLRGPVWAEADRVVTAERRVSYMARLGACRVPTKTPCRPTPPPLRSSRPPGPRLPLDRVGRSVRRSPSASTRLPCASCGRRADRPLVGGFLA